MVHKPALDMAISTPRHVGSALGRTSPGFANQHQQPLAASKLRGLYGMISGTDPSRYRKAGWIAPAAEIQESEFERIKRIEEEFAEMVEKRGTTGVDDFDVFKAERATFGENETEWADEEAVDTNEAFGKSEWLKNKPTWADEDKVEEGDSGWAEGWEPYDAYLERRAREIAEENPPDSLGVFQKAYKEALETISHSIYEVERIDRADDVLPPIPESIGTMYGISVDLYVGPEQMQKVKATQATLEALAPKVAALEKKEDVTDQMVQQIVDAQENFKRPCHKTMTAPLYDNLHQKVAEAIKRGRKCQDANAKVSEALDTSFKIESKLWSEDGLKDGYVPPDTDVAHVTDAEYADPEFPEEEDSDDEEPGPDSVVPQVVPGDGGGGR